ncbi:MAG: DUF370 domain-containing protein [Oscillospiraceae bacterium]|nr:DUF370 domain-containing protein [Oscillospiraceae bacterium]
MTAAAPPSGMTDGGVFEMYLHLGKDVLVEKRAVVCICDLDNASSSYLTREALARAQKAGAVINAAEDLPKSFVVCQTTGGQRVYLSQLASSTLLKRAESQDLI